MKKFVALYEKKLEGTFPEDSLYRQNYPEAFKLGGEILKDEPENLKILMDLDYAGYPHPAPRTTPSMRKLSTTPVKLSS